jgi:hypothetical protein
MNRSRPTHLKREKEKARRERQQRKTARRAEAAVRRATNPHDKDADLAGIKPGPQPSPWGDDDTPPEEG